MDRAQKISLANEVRSEEFSLPGKTLYADINAEFSTREKRNSLRRQRANLTAVRNWLTKYRPPSHASDLEKVRGYLEAFHHLCEIDAFDFAYKILTLNLDTQSEEDFHELLGTWGAVGQRIELYERLLGQLEDRREIVLLDGLSHAYHSIGDYQEALDYADRYFAEADRTDNITAEARALGLFGIINHALGNYQVAVEFHCQRLDLAQKAAFESEQIKSLCDLGIAYYSLGDFQDSLDCHLQQYNLSSLSGDRLQQVQALGSLGNLYHAIGDYDKAIEHYDHCLDLGESVGDRLAVIGSLTGIGNVCHSLKSYEQSLSYHGQSLSLAREIQHRRTESIALLNMANVYAAVGDGKEAQQLCNQSLAIARAMGNRGGEGQALHMLGLVYQLLQEYELAIECMQDAIEIAVELEDSARYASTLCNLGNIFNSIGDRESKWLSWLESLLVFDSIELQHRVEMFLQNFSLQIYKDFGVNPFEEQISSQIYEGLFSKQLQIIKDKCGEEGFIRILELLCEV